MREMSVRGLMSPQASSAENQELLRYAVGKKLTGLCK